MLTRPATVADVTDVKIGCDACTASIVLPLDACQLAGWWYAGHRMPRLIAMRLGAGAGSVWWVCGG